MSDSYPESFTIEIEREKLCRYLRRQWTMLAGMPLLGFGLLFGFAFSLPPKGRNDFESAWDVATTVAIGIAIGFTIGAVLVMLIHLLFLRKAAKREADALHVSVEGPYFRIKEGVSNIKDRKLHFRAIIDYAYFQDSMMRECGVGGLELNTIGRGQDATIRLKGIKNALEVRDKLSEIDRLRENA